MKGFEHSIYPNLEETWDKQLVTTKIGKMRYYIWQSNKLQITREAKCDKWQVIYVIWQMTNYIRQTTGDK